MRTLFVMDPIENVIVNHDSTFSTMLEAQQRHYEMFYATLDDLQVFEGEPLVDAKRIQVKPVQGDHCELSQPLRMSLNSFDLIFMRKDPPFDLNYIFATYILDLVDPEVTRVVNRPSALRNCNEKAYILRFKDVIPKTLVSRNPWHIQEFTKALPGPAILKPLSGFGGRDIHKIEKGSSKMAPTIQSLTEGGSNFIMAQEYIADIEKTGDKRIIVIDGQAVGAVARFPKPGEHRANLAVGGRAEKAALTPRDLHIVKTIAPRLKADGISLAGLDVIGDYLTEINITSPTMFQEIDRFDGISCAAIWLDSLKGPEGAPWP